MPVIVNNSNVVYSYTILDQPVGAAPVAPTTYSGTTLDRDTQTTSKGVYPYVIHNDYGRSILRAAIVSGTSVTTRRNSAGKVVSVGTITGQDDKFLTWDLGPEKPYLAFDTPTRLYNLAVLDMYNELAEAKVGLGQIIAELKRTSESIVSSLLPIASALISAKKLRWKQVLKDLGIDRHSWRASANNIGARWLEVSFGWLPLLGDIDDLLAFVDSAYRKPLYFSVKGKKFEQVNERHSRPSPRGANRFYAREGRRGYSAQMLVRVDNDAFVDMNTFGVQPLPTLWELSPFSFLLDYIVPVGDWLRSLSAMDGLIYQSGSYTRLYVASHKEAAIGSFVFGRTSYVMNQRATSDIVSMQRITWEEPPFPLLALKYPLTSITRGANIASLLAQTLRDPVFLTRTVLI